MTIALLFVILQFVCALAYFVLFQRPLFMLYNKASCQCRLSLRDVAMIYMRGVPTDYIPASYITILPLLVLCVDLLTGLGVSRYVLIVYHALLSVAVSLITLGDAVLYSFWHYKLEFSVVRFLRHPKAAFASINGWYQFLSLVAIIVVACISYVFLHLPVWLVGESVYAEQACLWWHYPVILIATMLLAGVLFLFIRGLGHRPNNPSKAYFSAEPYLNHSALNPIFNVIYSIKIGEGYDGLFQEFDPDFAQRRFATLFPTGGIPQQQLLNTTRPNILLVVWESLCARFIESLGGKAGVMPHFDRLAGEGVLFTRCDAGSFRTDRGLVCVLSGIPGQPTTSIMRHTRKLPFLPALPRALRDAGYDTMAVHGGDCAVLHKMDYYTACGHNTVMQQRDLPHDAPTCHWGINDGYMFDWLYDDIVRKSAQGDASWYTTFQTLSSHEPYDVPYNRLPDKMDNSYAYVDECFGRFIDKLKQTAAWKNLLVVVVGDHGCNEDALDRSRYPHIPVLMLGGAVNHACRIDTIMSQTDLPATLLGQMRLPHGDFSFSRDVLADTYTQPFSLHTFQCGFMIRNAGGYTIYDNNSQSVVEGADEERIETGKVIQQELYRYLARLGEPDDKSGKL